MAALTPVTFHTVAVEHDGLWTYEVAVSLEAVRWSMADLAPKENHGGHWRPAEFLSTWGDRLENYWPWLLPYVVSSIDTGTVDATILADATHRNGGIAPKTWVWEVGSG